MFLRHLAGSLCALALLIGPAVAETRCPEGVERIDEVVAEAAGLTVERLNAVKVARSLDNDDVCTMPQAKLDRALFRLDNPMPDHPGDWAKFRAKQQADERGVVAPNGLVRAMEARRRIVGETQKRRAARGAAAGLRDPSPVWTPIGPTKVGGRVRSILIHPTNPSRMWTGSVAGGLWTTADAGGSWTPVNDFLPNLSISSLVMAPNDPNTIYAGTGEGYFNGDAVRGAGIFRSTDGGVTWTQMSSTNPALNADWFYVNRIAIAPDNPQVMLAATREGIYRTKDGGASWARTTLNWYGDSLGDVDFHPTNGNLAVLAGMRPDSSYATGGAWYSTDGGRTWLKSDLPSFGRAEIAWSRSSPNVLFASVDEYLGYTGGIFKSINFGANWTLVSTVGHLGNQGWYDNTIWVDPTNADHVIIGGIDLYRSTNGGTSFTKISAWYEPNSVHADHHVIVEHPGYNGTTNKTVYFGNDGGVYRATDISAVAVTQGWTNLNNGLAITQFYSGAGHNGTNGRIYGGTQDNGSLVLELGGEWTTAYGGDGGASAVDPTDGNYIFGEYVYLQLHRSGNGGLWTYDIYQGISDAGDYRFALFIAPFALDPNNPRTLFAGGRSLWRSTNAKANAVSWSRIFDPPSGRLSQIHVAEGNSNVVWFGTEFGDLYKSTNATAGSHTFAAVTSPVSGRMVLTLLVDKDNVNRVYAGFGGYSRDNLWRTDNGGTTWTSIGTGLPESPVRSILRHPYNPNWLYVGTEVGVFTSEDGGATWSATNDGPANVSTDQLFWYDKVNPTLVAATHGRGMFMARLADPRLTVAKAGSGGGTVVSNPEGLNCGATCAAVFPNAVPVTLTASAATNSRFDGWSGGCSGTSPTCTLSMTSPTAVTATFVATRASLTVVKSGTGAGTVTSAPGGIDCGPSCNGLVDIGATVTLTATPAADSSFAGWTGACAGTDPTCTLTFTAATTVGAAFSIAKQVLTVARSGDGAGSVTSTPAGILCGEDCGEPFDVGTTVTLTATPAPGSVFAGWSGACQGTTPICGVTVTTAASAVATFAPATFAVTVARTGSGRGTVASDPAGIDCGTDCGGDFPTGSTVTLRATAASGSIFTRWSGDCSGEIPTCAVAVNRALAVSADFAVLKTKRLTVTRKGRGMIVSSPAGIECGTKCKVSFPVGRTVTLTAKTSGSRFSGWSGSCSGGSSKCKLTMSRDRKVTATFTTRR
jgi:hypothetical protein